MSKEQVSNFRQRPCDVTANKHLCFERRFKPFHGPLGIRHPCRMTLSKPKHLFPFITSQGFCLKLQRIAQRH